MSPDLLLVHQLIGCDVFWTDVLEARIAQFHKIRRAKGGSVEGFQSGSFNRVVDRRHARIERRVKTTVLIVTNPSVQMQIGQDGEITLRIDSVALPVPLDRGRSRLLAEIIPIFSADRDDMPLP